MTAPSRPRGEVASAPLPPLLAGLWIPTRAGLAGDESLYVLSPGPGDSGPGVSVFHIREDLVVARSSTEALGFWAELRASEIAAICESEPGIEVLPVALETSFDIEGSAPLTFRAYLRQALAEGVEIPSYVGTEMPHGARR